MPMDLTDDDDVDEDEDMDEYMEEDDEVFGDEDGLDDDLPMHDPVHDVQLGTEDRHGPGGSNGAGANSGKVDLEFEFKGHKLHGKVTVLQAILNHLITTGGSGNVRLSNSTIWEDVYTIKYRRAKPHESDVATAGAPAEGAAEQSGGRTLSALSPLAPQREILAGKLPHCDLPLEGPAYQTLWLLCTLESLVANRAEFTVGDGAKPRKCPVPALAWDTYVCTKLSTKLTQQMQEILIMCSGSMPKWCGQLAAACPFVFPFESRRRLFYCTALGMPRALHWLQHNGAASELAGSHHHHRDYEPRMGRLQRQKVRISRNKILESAKKVMELNSARKMVLEVEFFNEVGTGTGPTLEFYTLVSHELQLRSLGLWRTDPVPAGATGEQADRVDAPHGLFPAPLKWFGAPEEHAHKVKEHFRLLGRLAAKAIQDGRLMDLPLAPAFYRRALRGLPLGMTDLIAVDPTLGRSLARLCALSRRKAALEATGAPAADVRALTLDGVPVEDLCMSFTFPGEAALELKPGGGGCEVTIDNLPEYVEAVANAVIGDGVAQQVQAFREGFSSILPVEQMQGFSEGELESLLCGSEERWTAEQLVDAIKLDHGYTGSSAPVRHLFEVLEELGAPDQRAFLRFVTGAPRLPPGGLRALNPKLTVVCRHPAGGMPAGSTPATGTVAADRDLPSAMTCANFLKLPPFSSKEVLKDRLYYAIREGQCAFDLS